jgi:diguanylate cyclase (GGDEF)-like protein
MADTKNPSVPPGSVLIVDDEELIRLLVAQILRRLGHAVAEAENLSAAREFLAQSPIELVLADIALGRESGLDLLHELASRSPELAVVMMTGNADIQTAINCLRDGAFDYLLKPFRSEDLLQVVNRVFERQRRMVAQRRQLQEQLRILGQFSSENPNPVLRVGSDGLLLYANKASAALLNQLKIQIGDPVPEFLRHLLGGAHTRDRSVDIELEGAGRIYSVTVTPLEDSGSVFLYGHDVSSLKEAEKQLIRLKDQAQELAMHDVLTGLPNRTLLTDRLDQAIAFTERTRTHLALVYLDLDKFKLINDTQGHKVGDQVLIALANRLRQVVRKSDTVARWGGDELIVLLPGLQDPDARPICMRLKDTVQKLIAQQDGFFVTMSMGVAIYPTDATEPDQLLQAADAALYLAKSRAGNEVVLFSDNAALKSFRKKDNIRALLKHAIAEDRLQVFFQPIVDARTSRVVGAEALARWFEEGHGAVSPSVFIPLAENAGLIDDLGRQVLEKALRQLNLCHQQGFPLSLAINVSLRQLLRHGFTKDLLLLAKQVGLKLESLSQVTLEITETQALLGITTEARRFQELALAGFRLSIDDFGQGHSSLASLHEMPVEELKIDIQFVQNLHTKKGRRIVQTIVELSRTLGLAMVAEGVETPEQRDILKDMGVQRLQGYLFSKPLPDPEFLAYLKSQAASSGPIQPAGGPERALS